MRWLVSPDWNWRSSEYCPALISTPASPDRRPRAAAAANPSTTALISLSAISMGSSREAASGTRDGAHSADWENAEEPCIPA